MPNTLYRAYYSGSDVAGGIKTALAPSSELYALAFPGLASGAADFGRIDSTDSFAWSTRLTTGASCWWYCASGGGYFVVAAALTGSWATRVALYSAAGSLLWQTSAPVRISRDSDLAVNAGAVYLFAPTDGLGDAVLLKLAIADGTLSWATNLRETSQASGTNYTYAVQLLSGGDPVVSFAGPVHTNGVSRGYVRRVSASDGSPVWTRSIATPSSSSKTGLAVDPSDNIYVIGAPYAPVSDDQIPVLKLDASGATLWAREVQYPTDLPSPGVSYDYSTCGVGSSTGLLLFTRASDNVSVNSPVGLMFVPTGGGIAGDVVHYVVYTQTGSFFDMNSSSGAASSMVLSYRDETVAPDISGVIAHTTESPDDDRAFGPYTRDTQLLDLVSSTSSAAAASLTMAATPSITMSASSMTSSSSALQLQVYVATGGQVQPYTPSTQFGSASAVGPAGMATSLGEVTQFGPVGAQARLTASATAPTTQFGAAAYEADRTCEALGRRSTQLGTPLAYRDPVPAPAGRARGFVSFAAGTATAAASGQRQVAGFAAGAFGTPAAGTAVTAASTVATEFGAARAGTGGAASGFISARFGAPQRTLLGTAVGAALTSFGQPAVRAGAATAASSLLSASFGTPSCSMTVHRTRSAYFRTQWGAAQVERT